MPWSVGQLATADAVIAAVGFEQRSRHVAGLTSRPSDLCFAAAFADRRVHSFAANYRWYVDAGYDVQEPSDHDHRDWIGNICGKIEKGVTSSSINVVVDVSSLSRFRLGVIVDVIRTYRWSRPVNVQWVYSIAAFTPPSVQQGVNVHVGPVINEFAGWTMAPDQAPVVLAGLGYEQDRALGAVEHLQPARLWVFLPESSIEAYEEHLLAANETLLQDISHARRFQYRVEQPYDAYALLEAITARALPDGNVVLLPFGPKIFATACLLVSCVHPFAAVWRVSAGVLEDPVDRFAAGSVSGLISMIEPRSS